MCVCVCVCVCVHMCISERVNWYNYTVLIKIKHLCTLQYTSTFTNSTQLTDTEHNTVGNTASSLACSPSYSEQVSAEDGPAAWQSS